MTRLVILLLSALLLAPLAVSTADAKATSTAPQVHVVKRGDTLYDIARRHGLTVTELKRLNGLSGSRLRIGQKLALTRAAAPPLAQRQKPATAASRASRPAPADSGASYLVKRGDSLYAIARRHGMTVDQLRRINGLSGTRLKIGQQLALTSGSAPEAARTAHQASSSAEAHVVRKGETLYSIARRHGMAVDDLKRINDLSGSRLRIGQRLALASPEPATSPLLLPGDSSEDEVLEMAYASGNELEQVAFNYLSTPYRFGGNSRKGIDCSGFVQQVFREMDVDLPRSAREQFRVGTEVERNAMQKGDLIFFRTYAKYPSHVGIYLGDGKMIHASSRSRRVVVTSIDHPYYRKRFIGAKRISLLDNEEFLSAAAGVQEDPDGEVADAAAPTEHAAPEIAAAAVKTGVDLTGGAPVADGQAVPPLPQTATATTGN